VLEVPLPASESTRCLLAETLGDEGECEGTEAGMLPQTLRFHGYVTAFEAKQGPGCNSPRDLQEARIVLGGMGRGVLWIPAEENIANHRHFQTFPEPPFTSGFGGERQASVQFTHRVRLSSISHFPELP